MARPLMTLNDILSRASIECGIAQQRLASAISSLDQDIVQMRILLYAVADELLMEEPYKSTLGDDCWIAAADGTPKQYFSADDDFCLFDGRLAVDGVKFRFLAAKGLEYGEALRDFQSRLNKVATAANGTVIDLYADEGRVQ